MVQAKVGKGGLLGVFPLMVAKNEGRKLLTEAQYWHAVGLAKRLSEFGNRQAMSDMDISPVEDMWELKDKGGILGKLNLRVFFAHVKARHEIVILGVEQKQQEGKTPRHVIIKMQNRLDSYLGQMSRG